MSKSAELASTEVSTSDGAVRAVLLDRVGPDRILLMLMKANSSSKYAGVSDDSPVISPEIRKLLVQPKKEDG
jgi:hypothetical protein